MCFIILMLFMHDPLIRYFIYSIQFMYAVFCFFFLFNIKIGELHKILAMKMTVLAKMQLNAIDNAIPCGNFHIHTTGRS